MRILVVEDHADSAMVMAKLLRIAGHTASAALSIAEAKKLCAQEQFDLLICDRYMSDGDGWKFFAELAESSDVKGIAITGAGRAEDAIYSRQAGLCELLLKPISPDRLEATIRRVTGSSHVRD